MSWDLKAHLTVSFFLWSSGSNARGELRAPCQLKKHFIVEFLEGMKENLILPDIALPLICPRGKQMIFIQKGNRKYNWVSGTTFPSSRLIADGTALNSSSERKAGGNPRADTPESRVAAYNLLVELAKDCPENTEVLTNELIQVHHTSRAKSTGKSVNFFISIISGKSSLSTSYTKT